MIKPKYKILIIDEPPLPLVEIKKAIAQSTDVPIEMLRGEPPTLSEVKLNHAKNLTSNKLLEGV